MRIARALNRLWQRRGPVFSDRFHERALRSPREVRNSLVYVLQDARKHGIGFRGPDPFSSGEAFDGWADLQDVREQEKRRAAAELNARSLAGSRAGSSRSSSRSSTAESTLCATAGSSGSSIASAIARPLVRVKANSTTADSGSWLARACTWLLSIGWKRHGLIRTAEVPEACRRPRR